MITHDVNNLSGYTEPDKEQGKTEAFHYLRTKIRFLSQLQKMRQST